MKKLILMLCFTLISVSHANILVAKNINAVRLQYASEIYDDSKLKVYAKEFYLERLEIYAKNLNLFYDDYSISINELKQELTIFCLLENKFKDYDRSLGIINRQEVCQPIYKIYNVTYNNINDYVIQEGENTLIDYKNNMKINQKDKIYEHSVQVEREHIIRVVTPKYLRNTNNIVEQLYDPDRIE